ncbi:MAG: ABC transporter permease [Candidatus Hodarchaeales archaeon]|jgi:ABC-type Na+ efflux pump permease subunit
MIRTAWIIAKKEIRLLFKSTRRKLLLFATPIIMFIMFVLILIFSSLIAIDAERPLDVTVIQNDEEHDGINWGDGFYTLLKSHDLTKDYIYKNESVTNLNAILQEKDFTVLLYIPANFSAMINQSVPAQFFIHYNNDRVNSQGMVANILTLSQDYNIQIIYYYHGIVNLTNIYVIPERLGGDEGADSFIASYFTMIPLYAILLLVVPSLSLVLISVTIEREQKTLESLILQPIERKSIIAGKLLYGSILVVFNSVITLTTILAIMVIGLIILPESLKTELVPIIESIIEAVDITVWLFILFMLLGLVLVSLLVITAAVLFSLMAKDEREANMVVSALVIIPLVSTLLIAFLPVSEIAESFQFILVLIPLLGYLVAIYLSLTSGELTLISWFSLVGQLGWILIGIWSAGRLIESEGILEISYKRFFRFRRKK